MSEETTVKEFVDEVKKNHDEIVITGKIGKILITIKGTGKIAWLLAVAAIAICVAIVIASLPAGGVPAVVAIPALAPAVAILGPSAALGALQIAVAGGGIAILKKIRQYDIVDLGNDKYVLRKSKK